MALLVLVSTPSLTPAATKTDYVYGPAPDWAAYRALGEAALRQQLADSDNWSIDWPNGYIPLGWEHGVKGYMTCGVVRPLKPDGKGRYLSHPFAVVIDYGAVKELDYQPDKPHTLVNRACPVLPSLGKLPPASLMPGAGPSPAAGATFASNTVASLGVSIRPMPEGAYIASVEAGSPAARAGLTPGMVIARANGIALAGLGEAMAKLLAAYTPALTLETASGAKLVIDRAASK